MLNVETLSFLRTAEGEALLAEAASATGELLARLSRLRKRWPADKASAAIELLELRDRAKAKFTRADRMFFTREGLEQSSGERVAAWRASRFPEGARILDLCCGIGGDAVALAARGAVTAIDWSPAATLCAEANAYAYRVELRTVCGDVTRADLSAGAAFWDPSRRRNGRRVRSGQEYGPPLAFHRDVLRSVPNLAVKVSPALPDEEIATMQREGARVEFLSDGGECKEAVLWFGDIGPRAGVSASLLPAGLQLAHDPTAGLPPMRPPGAWLIEPDPAVIRAHLLAEVCAATESWLLDPEIAYLGAEHDPRSSLGQAYLVREWLPFNLKRLREWLRKNGRSVEVVKRRGVPMEPEEVRRKLSLPGGEPVTLILGRVAGAPTAFLCEMPGRP